MPQYFKIAGPPGTGKTTALLTKVNDLLSSGISPRRILYTTFTRAGAYEAKDRGQEKFSLSDEDLKYFRTLHSLCLRQLGLSASLMAPADWVALGKSISVFFPLKRTEDGGMPVAATKGAHLLSALSLARNFRVSLQEAFNHYPDNHRFRLKELEFLDKALTQYKETYGKLDYTDLLEKALERGEPLDIDYAIGDEMQDLTPLQWDVFNLLTKNANTVWLAGDDDQCLYEWAGASSEKFIDAPGELQVLEQSYRIPSKVHEVAEKIASKIKKRLPKTYNPREAEGEVLWNVSLDTLDMSKGKWLILVRNLTFAKDLAAFCLYRGWRITSNIPFEGVNVGQVDAVSSWKRLQKGEPCFGKDLKNIAKRLKRKAVTFGYKQLWDNLHDDDLYDRATLIETFGLTKEQNWAEVFSLTKEESAYLKVLDSSKQLEESARIEISTIHNAKGRECDNVVLCVDQTNRTKEAETSCPDPEHRVWYVAVTRAKERLVILQPLTLNYYEI